MEGQKDYESGSLEDGEASVEGTDGAKEGVVVGARIANVADDPVFHIGILSATHRLHDVEPISHSAFAHHMENELALV